MKSNFQSSLIYLYLVFVIIIFCWNPCHILLRHFTPNQMPPIPNAIENPVGNIHTRLEIQYIVRPLATFYSIK